MLTTPTAWLNQGELEHRAVKAFYRRTSKQDYIKQTTRLHRRQERIQKITESAQKLGINVGAKIRVTDRRASTPLPPTQPALRYQTAETSKHWIPCRYFDSGEPQRTRTSSKSINFCVQTHANCTDTADFNPLRTF